MGEVNHAHVVHTASAPAAKRESSAWAGHTSSPALPSPARDATPVPPASDIDKQ